jgi:hypothetical protein
MWLAWGARGWCLPTRWPKAIGGVLNLWREKPVVYRIK